MSTAAAPITLARLWREMTPEQKTRAAHAFWLDDDSMAQQVEAVTHLARQLHFRPQSVLGLPVERKIRQLATQGRLPDNVIARTLVVYHLAEQRPMLTAFLDHLGVPHEDGVIGDDVPALPDAATIQAAARRLAESWPAPDVRLYLLTLAIQDPETWGPAGEIAETM